MGEFEGTGLTQREFCERRGVKFTAFRNWLYRLHGTSHAQTRRKGQGGFVQIVGAASPSNVACRLRVGGAELVFSEVPRAEYLGELLRLMDR